VKLVKAIKNFKPDFIYERYNLYQPAGIWAARIFNLPIILEVNAPLVEERSRYSGLSLKRLAKKIENYTWKGATHCLPVTDVLAEHLRQAGVLDTNITVIHNGVRQTFIDEMLVTPIEQNENEIVVGFTGFINPWHGMDKAIEAIAEHKELPLKLICIGDCKNLSELKNQALELGVADKVEFKGLVTRDKVLMFVKQFDIALQPDVTAYASPLKMFEYMAVGSLIVAPDCPNIREILDEKTALFFELGKQESFKKTLNEAIEHYLNHSDKRIAVKQSVIDKGFIWHENSKKIVKLANKLQKFNKGIG
jgi:glycosyltransferase involved in cell wall biosynthesis